MEHCQKPRNLIQQNQKPNRIPRNQKPNRIQNLKQNNILNQNRNYYRDWVIPKQFARVSAIGVRSARSHPDRVDNRGTVARFLFATARNCAQILMAPYKPAVKSATGTPHFTGAPSGSPVTLMMPLKALS